MTLIQCHALHFVKAAAVSFNNSSPCFSWESTHKRPECRHWWKRHSPPECLSGKLPNGTGCSHWGEHDLRQWKPFDQSVSGVWEASVVFSCKWRYVFVFTSAHSAAAAEATLCWGWDDAWVEKQNKYASWILTTDNGVGGVSAGQVSRGWKEWDKTHSLHFYTAYKRVSSPGRVEFRCKGLSEEERLGARAARVPAGAAPLCHAWPNLESLPFERKGATGPNRRGRGRCAEHGREGGGLKEGGA